MKVVSKVSSTFGSNALVKLILVFSFFSPSIRADRVYRCSKLAETIPDRVNCPSFNRIISNLDDETVSVFCIDYMQFTCFLHFSDDPEMAELYRRVVCNLDMSNIITTQGYGLQVKNDIHHTYSTLCR